MTLEITECGRTLGGGLVVFDVRWEGEPTGETVWAVRITSADRAETVELGYARGHAGEQQYVAADGRRQPVETDVDVREGEITARFPEEVVGVAIEWPTWTAVLSVDGEVVAEHAVPTA